MVIEMDLAPNRQANPSLIEIWKVVLHSKGAVLIDLSRAFDTIIHDL